MSDPLAAAREALAAFSDPCGLRYAHGEDDDGDPRMWPCWLHRGHDEPCSQRVPYITPDVAPLLRATLAAYDELRIEHEAHSALLTAARADRDRLRIEASEARARIAVMEEDQRRDLADVEHFRAMARGYMDERDEARAAIAADLSAKEKP